MRYKSALHQVRIVEKGVARLLMKSRIVDFSAGVCLHITESVYKPPPQKTKTREKVLVKGSFQLEMGLN